MDNQGKPLGAFGELGLTGELREVVHAERRLGEAKKFGLSVLAPGDGLKTARSAIRAAVSDPTHAQAA
jgi:DNA repair protein RadA/Sms